MNTNSIKERNIFLSIFLTFITCGIYGIFWFFATIGDVYKLDEATDNLVLDIILSFITCGLYVFFLLYKVSNKLVSIKTKAGLPASSNTAVFILLHLFGFGIINSCIIQDELNNIKRFGEVNSMPNNTPAPTPIIPELTVANDTVQTTETTAEPKIVLEKEAPIVTETIEEPKSGGIIIEKQETTTEDIYATNNDIYDNEITDEEDDF